MMRSASYVLSMLALVTFSGCFGRQYAALYVRSEPENAQAWSGKSGQYLGDTPFVLRYEKTNGESNPIAVIVFKKLGYQANFTIVEIDRWRPTWAEANVDQNTASVTLEPIGAPSVPKTSEAAATNSNAASGVAAGERGYQSRRAHREPGTHPVTRGRFFACAH